MRDSSTDRARVINELHQEETAAAANPRVVYGYARYGTTPTKLALKRNPEAKGEWWHLDYSTHGIHKNNLIYLGGRQKTGKSMLLASWIPNIAAQCPEGEVVRLFSLEMSVKMFYERMAAIRAFIPDPINIKTGFLTEQQRDAYHFQLDYLDTLPIDIHDTRMDFRRLASIVDNPKEPTFFWALDNFGLMGDLGSAKEGGVTGAVQLANNLQDLAQGLVTGLVVGHLNRASVGKRPDLSGIAATDQLGRNADEILLLHRIEDTYQIPPDTFENGLTPAELIIYSRHRAGGNELLWWSRKHAQFREMPQEDMEEWLPIIKQYASRSKKGR